MVTWNCDNRTQRLKEGERQDEAYVKYVDTEVCCDSGFATGQWICIKYECEMNFQNSDAMFCSKSDCKTRGIIIFSELFQE